MTDDRAQVQPDAEEITASIQPRGTYAGYRAFGSGDGAVLVEPGLVHQLRAAAELATQEGRCTGGLLFGRRWADDQGRYLVVSGFVEAGPDASGDGDFLLSEAELRLLREDAAAMYAASYEVGWWRTLAVLGEFGPRDLAAQAELAGPDSSGQEGVGLLVYGSGIHWGTAYLGPDGRAPDSAGTLVIAGDPGAAPLAGPEPPLEPDPLMDLEAALEPDPGTADLAAAAETGPEVVDIAAGESLLAEGPPLQEDPLFAQEEEEELPQPDSAWQAGAAPLGGAATEGAAPGRARRRARPAAGQPRRRVRPAGQPRQRMSSRVQVPTRARGWARAGRPVDAGYPGAGYQDAGESPRLPADAQLVVTALALAFVAAAIIVGFLVHSVIVAVIIAVVGLLAVASTVWMSRYH